MAEKQDAWNLEVAAFDAGVTEYVTMRDGLLARWDTHNLFLNDFLGGTDKTQAEWDAEVLALRQATVTWPALFQNGVVVQPAETHMSFLRALGPCYTALQMLEDLAAQYINDDTVPNNVRNQLGRIDFVEPYFAYTPAGLIYQTELPNGTIRTKTVRPPHWWLLPNQFSTFLRRGRTEPTLEEDPARVRAIAGVRFTPAIDDADLFTARDQCAAVTGID